jgi:hypothetical protein
MLLTSLVTFWLTRRHYICQQHRAFVEQQLKEFYSPLLGWREKIRMTVELRVRLFAASNEEWQQRCAEARKMHDPIQAYHQLEDELGSVIKKGLNTITINS